MKTIHKKNTTFLNLAAGLLVAALVLGCKPNVSNGDEVQPEKFTVTFNVNGGNGKLTANPVIPAGGKVAKDAEITFTATANPGYRVDTWAITGGAIQAGGQQGDTTAKVKVTANTTVNVTFTPIVYTPVSYDNLSDHLTGTQPASDGIYYIEVTGLTAPDVKGNILSDSESPLGKILKKNKKKKVALKFGTISYGVTDMTKCFEGCTNLVQVSNIPDSITDMSSCFVGCTSLTSVTLKCEYLDGKFNVAFSGCRSLSADSIKVPADSLDDYKDNANKMDAKAEWFAKDE